MKKVLSTTVLVISIVAMVLFLAGPATAFFGVLPPQTGFLLFGLGCLLGIPTGLAGAIMLVRSGPMPGGAIAILGGLPALVLIYSLVGARGIPMINDVATDVAFPPTFTHAQTLEANTGRAMEFPAGNAAIVKESYSDLEPLGLSQSVDDVFGRASDFIRSQEGWELTYSQVSDTESVIEGTATSSLFHFVDDFVIRITAVESNACVVDVRSKSRDGKGDFGVNADRIRDILAALKG